MADFTLDLPGTCSGHLVEMFRSLVLEITGTSSMPAPAAPGDALLPAENPPLSAAGSALFVHADFSQFANVPEPGSATLLAFGSPSLLSLRCRQRNKRLPA